MPVAKLPMRVAARPVRFLLGTAAGLTSVVTLVAAGMPASPQDPGSNVPGGRFLAVSALSPADAWAVGYFSPSLTSGAQKPLVLYWDGARWARVASPAPGDTLVTALNGVAAISPSDAWAVGDVFNGTTQTQRTLVFHWDGTGWTHVPAPSPGFATLYGVAGMSASDAWAVGQGTNSLILRWNGSRWTQS